MQWTEAIGVLPSGRYRSRLAGADVPSRARARNSHRRARKDVAAVEPNDTVSAMIVFVVPIEGRGAPEIPGAGKDYPG